MCIIANLKQALTHFSDENARLARVAAAARCEENDLVEEIQEDRDAHAGIAAAIDTLLASDLFAEWAEGLLHEASNHTNGGETVTLPASTEAQPGNPGRAKPFKDGYWNEKRDTITPEQFESAPTLKEAVEAGDVKDGDAIGIAEVGVLGGVNVERARFLKGIGAMIYCSDGPRWISPSDWKFISEVSSEQHASDTAKQVTSNPTTDKVLKSVADTSDCAVHNTPAIEGARD